MNKYELLLVLPGTLNEQESAARAAEIETLVKGFSQDVELHNLGKNRLAYPIKQIRYGYFYTVVFSSDTKQIVELQAKLSLLRDVLRAMVSHFNTNLTAAQKISYHTDASGVTTMIEREEDHAKQPVVAATQPTPLADVPERKKEKKEEVFSLEDINKKLDDIMGGDVAGGI